MAKVKRFTDKDPDFICVVPTEQGGPNGMSYGGPKKFDIKLEVWKNGEDIIGRKLFYFLCHGRRYGDDQPSEIRYDPEEQTIETRHPEGCWRGMKKVQTEAFIAAYELEFVAEKILLEEIDDESDEEADQ